MFWKKKQNQSKTTPIVLGMIMLKDREILDAQTILKDFKEHYHIGPTEIDADETAVAFKIDGESVALGVMPVPIPNDDLIYTAQYAYNWESSLEDIKDHKAHIIVSVIQGSDDQVKRYMLFTRIVCSILRTTSGIGLYQGGQSLLISKHEYLYKAHVLEEGSLPVDLWIYFGFSQSDNKNWGYTYGLEAFGKREMEVLYSDRKLTEIQEFLYNIAYYVIDQNVEFKAGETCGSSENERVKIFYSKGKLVGGNSFKLDY